MASVKDGYRNLPLKFGQHRVSNIWDIPYMTNVPKTNLVWANVKLIVGICSRWSQKSTFFIKIGSVTAEILLTLSLCGGGWAKSFSSQTQWLRWGLVGVLTKKKKIVFWPDWNNLVLTSLWQQQSYSEQDNTPLSTHYHSLLYKYKH